MLPDLLQLLRPLHGRNRVRRAETQQRLFVTAVHGALCVVLLSGLLGYALLLAHLGRYRRAVLVFNPNAAVGRARFRLLGAELLDWPGEPTGPQRPPEVLLIQTSATRFDDLIAYCRRLASPNDHDLTAVFVRDAVAGQPWRRLARTLRSETGCPANWVAVLCLRQSGGQRGSNGCQGRLLDVELFRQTTQHRYWSYQANYNTDSITESLRQSPTTAPEAVRLLRRHSRRLGPTDAAYYSRHRATIRTGQPVP